MTSGTHVPRNSERAKGTSNHGKMMEEDDGNEIAGINALPPRVSKDEAYHPAKTPQKNGKRKR